MTETIFYLKANHPDSEKRIALIQEIDWKAGQFLATRYKEKNLATSDRIILVTDENQKLIALGALLDQDILNKDDYPLGPFLSTIYVAPASRGKGYSLKIISLLEDLALKQGFSKLYIVTAHTGLYEKCGYHFQYDVIDRFGRKMRLLKKHLG
ncbi:hypothetical protein AT575_08380 [Streptococcus penaeicida]|uniref:N-acetyltransferase domain-containing protein n=1 Tax=Streptococcus penaeicida TaxID=1765960 RepID=A0A2N8LAT1_9STRE|nr:GNAT family N-acetyltransferase [Streptococcus penaeicida]PND47269.1 hypothetical protein AT575_08380 [Streptococcus penaeicida]